MRSGHVDQAWREAQARAEERGRHARVPLGGQAEALRTERPSQRDTDREAAVLEAARGVRRLDFEVELHSELFTELFVSDNGRPSHVAGVRMRDAVHRKQRRVAPEPRPIAIAKQAGAGSGESAQVVVQHNGAPRRCATSAQAERDATLREAGVDLASGERAARTPNVRAQAQATLLHHSPYSRCTNGRPRSAGDVTRPASNVSTTSVRTYGVISSRL